MDPQNDTEQCISDECQPIEEPTDIDEWRMSVELEYITLM